MNTTKKKRTAPSPAKRQLGASELLDIAAELAEQVHRADHLSSGELASWRERSLASLDDPDEKRGTIRACRIQRDAGALDAGEALFIIHRFASNIAEEIYDTDAPLKRIVGAIRAAEKAHGLKDDEYWPLGEEPDGVEKLQVAWDRRADAILATVFRKHGETDMADLLLADRPAFMEGTHPGP